MVRALVWKEWLSRRRSARALALQLIAPALILFLVKLIAVELKQDTINKPIRIKGKMDAKRQPAGNEGARRNMRVYVHSEDQDLNRFMNMSNEEFQELTKVNNSACSGRNDTNYLGFHVKISLANSTEEIKQRIQRGSTRSYIAFFAQLYGKWTQEAEYAIGLIFLKKAGGQVTSNLLEERDVHLQYRIEQLVDDRPVSRIDYLHYAHGAILSRLYHYRSSRQRPEERNTNYTPIVYEISMHKRLMLENYMPNIALTTNSIGFLFFISLTVTCGRILSEKASEVSQLYKLAGVTTLEYYASYFLVDLLILLSLSTLYVVLFALNDFVAYACLLFLHSAAATLFALSTTVFFTNNTIGTMVYIMSNVLSLLSTSLVRKGSHIMPSTKFHGIIFVPDWLHLFFSVFAPPMYAFELADTILYEINDQESVVTDSGILTFEAVCVAMLWSCLFWLLVIFYIGEIWPWQRGTPKPPGFIFPYYTSAKARVTVSERDYPAYSERPPDDLKVGICINNVRKSFGPAKEVLKGITLKLYHGQITILLGHTGAGKTTLFNVLTGSYSVTKGQVLIDGIDVHQQPKQLGSRIGFCPQGAVLLQDLTVAEHLYLFASLKGSPWSGLESQVQKILQQLLLVDKANFYPENLSGGMKRRLQLGIALIGGSNVLILDEPTISLDAEARRGIWDILLSLKDDHLILMTTHHMQEADCLGDQIAILHRGEVKCYGSPLFLKNNFGLGYCIRVKKTTAFENLKFFNFLKSHFDTVAVYKDRRNFAVYNFKKEETRKIAGFFDSLDTCQEEMGIHWCRVIISSLHNVYFRMNDMFDLEFEAKERPCSASRMNLHPSFSKTFFALFSKRYSAVKRSNLFVILVSYVFLVSVPVTLLLHFSPVHVIGTGLSASFDVGKILSLGAQCSNKTFCDWFFDDDFEITNSVLNSTKDVGIAMDEGSDLTNNTKCFRVITKTEPSVAATTKLYNLITKRFIASHRGQVRASLVREKRIVRGMGVLQSEILSTLTILLTVIMFVIPYRRMMLEKVTKVKLLQFMAGVNPHVYWFSNFVFDFFICFVIFFPYTICLPITFVTNGINIMYTSYLTTVVGWLAYSLISSYAIILCYVMTFLTKSMSGGLALLMAINFGQAFIGEFIVNLSLRLLHSPTSAPTYVIRMLQGALWICASSPVFQASFFISGLNRYSYNSTFCADIALLDPGVCDVGNATSTNEWTEFQRTCCQGKFDALKIWFNSEVLEFLILYIPVAMAMGWLLLMTMELGTKQRVQKKIKAVPMAIKEEEEDVAREHEKIKNLTSAEKSKALVVQNLSKSFRSKKVIPNLNFMLEDNKCFGLLGINGAGKSTTLKLVIGEIPRSTGDIQFDQLSLCEHFDAYRSHIGYCPQSDAFVPGTTGEEMLTLMAKIKGVNKAELKATVDDMVRFIHLDDYAGEIVENCSGGTRRKLSIGMALIAWPKFLVLDEPTMEIDPVARLRIWNILEVVKETAGCTILLASHAMEECEALCDKVTILIDGQLQCIGSISHLRSKYGQGFLITIKLIPGRSNVVEVQKVMLMMLSSAKVQYKHKNMLQLVVTNPNLKRGTIYRAIDTIKTEHHLEDYEVSDIPLEHIFLNFARPAYAKHFKTNKKAK